MNQIYKFQRCRDSLWDKLAFIPAQLSRPPLFSAAEAELGVGLGKTALVPLRLDLPVFISHMSLGFVSPEAKYALARAASAAGTAVGGGGGGVLQGELELSPAYIYEYTPGLYGLTPEVLESCAAVEIKIGRSDIGPLGETLPEGLPDEVYLMRGAEPGASHVSPARFGEINSSADLRITVEGLREGCAGKPVGVKLAAGRIEEDLDMVVGSGADFVTVDGRSTLGGWCLPTLCAVRRARRRLDALGSELDIVAVGGMRTPSDFAKAIALGATAVATASAALCALGADDGGGIDEEPETAAERVRVWLENVGAELARICAFTGRTSVGELCSDDLVCSDFALARKLGIASI